MKQTNFCALGADVSAKIAKQCALLGLFCAGVVLDQFINRIVSLVEAAFEQLFFSFLSESAEDKIITYSPNTHFF